MSFDLLIGPSFTCPAYLLSKQIPPKVHNHAVTTMDGFRVDTWGSTSRSAKDEQIFPSTATMSGQLHGKEDPNAEYLVLSGSLDRSLCIFRVIYGEGLCILRRLNMGCAPRGLPGALFVDLQTKVEASGKGRPTQEVCGTEEGVCTRLEDSQSFGHKAMH